MILKILVIGDVGNIFNTIKKFSKSEIYIINFIQDGMGVYTYADNIQTFSSYKIKEQVKKINEIKDNFDICVTMGTGERVAYLADLNYIPYYVGRDIDAPRFIKNSKEEWFDEPLHTLNFIERSFYKKSFENAVKHVAYGWVHEHLKKFTKNGIKMDMEPIDTELFNENIKPIEKEKEKFTFFSPQRMGKPKGTDLLWKALEYCEEDFEILQVEWFDESTSEEIKIKNDIIKSRPEKVQFIPKIKRNDMPKYYNFSDAVIGNLRIGFHELITCEAVLCKKPIVQYANPKFSVIIEEEKIEVPFLPQTKDPREIAKILDRIVKSRTFREDLYEKELSYVRKISNPKKTAEWWDNFLEQTSKECQGIRKNSSKIKIIFRMMTFLIGNRLYVKKIKRILK